MNSLKNSSIKRKQMLVTLATCGAALLLACAGFVVCESLTFLTADRVLLGCGIEPELEIVDARL